ncbi:type I restriction-modification system subunit M [Paenibacillus urinalis]|uniref:site-specific DNA-methyltransferase (adenine-specific) n=1 Tax=Paenibacillus urinalis TaxID=521520 RepID=A0AAX3N2M3_9BACL|nr:MULTISPECIES: type I restriction-modification system subunit M [Paenibacillus]WDH82867.1 type I restriction-modification system subunit M [Paenibacillus urinalis]WDH98915.1 type I restriction-modification system subunit M [Paenibacillus urinalis]WDI02612.1 type I restriction-modification system subunit M [Paenibacillus urinalis]GAK42890.1 type I restriction modification system modification protein [Paenibacillus sp. TCA20]
MISSQRLELYNHLWARLESMRGFLEESAIRDYFLGIICYGYLSHKIEDRVSNSLLYDKCSFEEAWKNEEMRNSIREELVSTLGYVIEPQYLFSTMVSQIKKSLFNVGYFQLGIECFNRSIKGADSEHSLRYLFANMELSASLLRNLVNSESNFMTDVMVAIYDLLFASDNIDPEFVGEAYEFLISRFAESSGKKGGEFYTPPEISALIAKIVTADKDELRSVYDPTCGSASLLLQIAKEAKVGHFYGQEKMSTIYNMARMNMLLHEVAFNRFDIRNDDALEQPKHLDMRFEAVVANPPYSAKWSAHFHFLDDERFRSYGVLAPQSKADFAFIQHMIHQLDYKGILVAILPLGILFRGGPEGKIRSFFVEKYNYIDAIIGLPPNLMYGTSIPVCIVVMKKSRETDDKVMFIDASHEYANGRNQNQLRNVDVNKIVDTYINKKQIEHYSYLATLDELKDNDYNLNISRYIDKDIENDIIDITSAERQLKGIDRKIAEIDAVIKSKLKELGIVSKNL